MGGARVARSAAAKLLLIGLAFVAIGIGKNGLWDRLNTHEMRYTPATLFSDGTWVVGEDVAEGTYVIDAKAGPDCVYYSLTKGGVEMDPDQVPDGRVAIKLDNGETIATTKCGIWRKR